jgi:hypothetical protein
MGNDADRAVPSTGLLACPFCGAVPEFYNGNYRVKHTTLCYLYDGQEYHWIVGVPAQVSAWDYRHGTTAH